MFFNVVNNLRSINAKCVTPLFFPQSTLLDTFWPQQDKPHHIHAPILMAYNVHADLRSCSPSSSRPVTSSKLPSSISVDNRSSSEVVLVRLGKVDANRAFSFWISWICPINSASSSSGFNRVGFVSLLEMSAGKSSSGLNICPQNMRALIHDK